MNDFNLELWKYPDGAWYAVIRPAGDDDAPTVIVAGEPRLQEGRGERIGRAPLAVGDLLGALVGRPVDRVAVVGINKVDLDDEKAAAEAIAQVLGFAPGADDCPCPRCVERRRHAN